MKSIKKDTKKDIEEIIYFALTNWDMNVMTKGFAKELAKQVFVCVRKDVIREILGEIVKNGSADRFSILHSLNIKYGELTGINIPKKW